MHRISLYNILAIVPKLDMDGTTHSDVKLQGYLRRSDPLDVDYKSLMSPQTYEYHQSQLEDGYVSEEYCFIQELATQEELKIIQDHIESSMQLIPQEIYNFERMPISHSHQSNFKRTFSKRYNLPNGLELVLYGYYNMLST